MVVCHPYAARPLDVCQSKAVHCNPQLLETHCDMERMWQHSPGTALPANHVSIGRKHSADLLASGPTVCHAKMRQFCGLMLKFEPTASQLFAVSDMQELGWWARWLLWPAPAPTKTCGTPQKQWWALLGPQRTVCHAKMRLVIFAVETCRSWAGGQGSFSGLPQLLPRLVGHLRSNGGLSWGHSIPFAMP